MKQKLLKKTVLLFAFIGLISTQLNAQQSYYFSIDEDGFVPGSNNTVQQVPNEGVTGDGILRLTGFNQRSEQTERNGIDMDTYKFVKIVVKNNTSANTIRVKFDAGGNQFTTVNVTPNAPNYETIIVDLTGNVDWIGSNSRCTIQFRNSVNATLVGASIDIDEIEFFSFTPSTTYSEFLQNPSFDDALDSGEPVGWNPANVNGATGALNFDEIHDGTGSLKVTYNAAATGTYFVFNTYEKDYVSLYGDLTTIQMKVWVKTNRTSVFEVIGTIVYTDDIADPMNPTSTTDNTHVLTTTKTDGTWEELTFDIVVPTGLEFNKLKGRFGIPSNNIALNVDDVVYFDEALVLVTLGGTAVTITSATDGNWEDATTWIGPTVPTSINNVIIEHVVQINNDEKCLSLVINADPGLLRIEAGKSLKVNRDVTTSNDLYLESSSTSFSSLIVLGTVTGNIRYSRRVTGSPTNDLISSPTTGWTFGDFISNNLNNNNLARHPTNLSERAFSPFDNENGVYVNYDEFANASTPIVTGKGYRVGRTSSGAFNFNGGAETGSISIAVTDETANNLAYGRWNLIGNPYPSYLDFGAFFNANDQAFDADAYQAIYGYDGDNSDGSKWTVWNNFNLTDKIAPGQGFFVRTLVGGGNVNFTPDMRTIGASDDFIVGRSTIPNYLESEFFLSKEGNTFATKIYFAENQTRGLDPGYDAAGFGGYAGGIFTHLVENNENIKFILQALPYQDFNDVVVPLGVNVDASVQATIGLDTATATIPSNINVYLEDTLTNTWTLLNTSDYNFTPTVSLNGTGRFYIHYSNSVLSVKDDTFSGLNINMDQSTKQVIVKGQLNNDTTATIYDIQGRTVQTKVLNQSSTTNTIDVNNLSTGIYIVKLQNASGSKSQKVILK